MSRPQSLTEVQRSEIRAAYAGGRAAASTLAARYGVSVRTVFRAVEGIHRGTQHARCTCKAGGVRCERCVLLHGREHWVTP